MKAQRQALQVDRLHGSGPRRESAASSPLYGHAVQHRISSRLTLRWATAVEADQNTLPRIGGISDRARARARASDRSTTSSPNM